MNLYLSIAFTLVAAVAGLYLLAKARAENLGKLFRVTAWLVIIVSGLSLLCQVGTGVCYMMCCEEMCSSSEACGPEMMENHDHMKAMHGGCGMHSGCNEMKECCSGEMRGSHGKCCDEMGEGGMDCGHDMKKGHGREEEKDSLKTH